MASESLEIRAKDLFFDIIELNPTERRVHLDEKVSGDEALRQRVLELLEGYERAQKDAFLEGQGEKGDTMDMTLLRRIGPYEIQRKIASGGMGAVYEALDIELHRQVALKVPHKNNAHRDMLYQRLRREGAALARLDHPHVVKIYQAGIWENDVPYIAMEYIDGMNLSELKESTRITYADILRWATQLAEALDYLHRHEMMHRDIKPRNILVKQNGDAVLTDFGIAHVSEMSRITVGSPGTPLYMCPEQYKGLTPDHRCDLYSLGLVLYELITGEPPHNVDRELLKKGPRTSPALAQAVSKCLSPDPEDRFQTGKEMVYALTEEGMAWPALAVMSGVGIAVVGTIFALVLLFSGWLQQDSTADESANGPTDVRAGVIDEPLPTPPEVQQETEPPFEFPAIIESLRNQSTTTVSLFNALNDQRDLGTLAFGARSGMVSPEDCYVFVFRSQNEPAEYILSPGDAVRTDLLSGDRITNPDEVIQDRFAIYVSLAP